MIRSLGRKFVSMTIGDTPQEKRIFEAVIAEDLDRVRKYIEYINEKNDQSQTPLHLAIELKKESIVEYLLSQGADIEARNKDEETPLIIAARQNNTAIFILIDDVIKKENHINKVDKSRFSALYYAANNGNIIISKKLKDRAANLSDWLYKKQESDYSETEQIVTNTLIEAGYDLDDLLSYAAKNYNMEAIKILIIKDANINKQDQSGNSAIHYISETCDEKNIREVIRLGADINLSNNKNDTALSIVLNKLSELKLDSKEAIDLKNKCTKLSKYLVKKGSNVSNNENVNDKLNKLDEQYNGLKKMLVTRVTGRETEKAFDSEQSEQDAHVTRLIAERSSSTINQAR